MALPVSLEDAKRQLRLPVGDISQDVEIAGFITDAAAWVEKYTGHILAARDVTESFRVPGRSVALRAWPVAPDAIVQGRYPGALGAPIAIIGARIDPSRRPVRVLPPIGEAWPLTSTDQLLTLTVRAGYETPDLVPGHFRRAMLVMITAFNEDREGGEVFQKAEASARMLCRFDRARAL